MPLRDSSFTQPKQRVEGFPCTAGKNVRGFPSLATKFSTGAKTQGPTPLSIEENPTRNKHNDVRFFPYTDRFTRVCVCVCVSNYVVYISSTDGVA